MSASPLTGFSMLRYDIYFFEFEYLDKNIFVNRFQNITKYLQIVDPKLASYGVENPLYAVIQLAQTTMRSEIGKITLDKSFEERDTLNVKIVVSFRNPRLYLWFC